MAKSQKLEADKFDGWNKAHREMLAHMATADIKKFIADGADVEHLNFAAVNIVDNDCEAALRIYDAMLGVPLDDMPRAAPVDATNALITAREEKSPAFTKERARQYIARWKPFAKMSTYLYLNLATLQVALGQLPDAIATLREGLEEGDPNLRSQIFDEDDDDEDDDFALLRKQPGWKALTKVESKFPRGLRNLELAIACETDAKIAEAAMKCDLELVSAHPVDDYFLADDPRVGDKKTGRAKFQVFGALPDGGEVAFWKRKADAPLAACPVVIFGSDGALSVYARDFDGFLSLLSHGVKMHDVEGDGFFFDDDEAWEPPSARELAKKLKPVKVLANAVAEWSPEAKKRKPEQERAAAMALVPELMKELAALSAKKKPTKKTANPKAKKKAKAKA